MRAKYLGKMCVRRVVRDCVHTLFAVYVSSTTRVLYPSTRRDTKCNNFNHKSRYTQKCAQRPPFIRRGQTRDTRLFCIYVYLRPRSIKCALARCKHHICINEKSNNPTIIINSNANRVAHTMQFEICVNFQLVLHNKFICCGIYSYIWS